MEGCSPEKGIHVIPQGSDLCLCGRTSRIFRDEASFEAWKNLLAGQSGVRKITRFDVTDFPTQFAAEVQGFDPVNYMEFKEAKRMVRCSQLAMAASKEAVRSSGLDLAKEDPTRVGIEIGTAIAGIDAIEAQMLVEH